MTINREGYRLVKAAGHPMANAGGWALEHRVVLFDAIGVGPHPCHWQCGRELTWRNPNPAWELLSDHLDDNRLNNTDENLVPACRHCNSTRGSIGSVGGVS